MKLEHLRNKSQFISLGVVAILGFVGLITLDIHSFLLVHSVAEMFSIGVALVIFFIAWNAREYFENGYFIFLGIAYLFVGGIDLLHTLAYRGMGVFPGETANLPTQFWILARYMESIALFSALFFLKKRIHEYGVFTLWFLISGVALLLIFSGGFPVCFIPGEGLTSFKKVSELIIVSILGITLLRMYRYRESFSKKVVWYLFGSLIVTMMAEIAFITYIDVYDLSNLVGHYFKIISFYLIYRGVIVTGFKDPYAILMKELKRRNTELEQSKNEIERAQRVTSTMLDNLPEEISLIDRKSLRIIDANQRFLDSYGLSKEEVSRYTCKEILDILPEEGEQKGLLCSSEFLKGSENKRVVQTHLKPEGGKRFMEISIWPVYRIGESVSEVVYISRDISEEKRLEQMKQDVERVIRHDLKSPLNGIVGATRILLDSGEFTSGNAELLEALYDSGLSVMKMVDRSLDMYKMEEGTYQLMPEEFDICHVLRALTSRWSTFRREKEIKLRILVQGQLLDEDTSLLVTGEQQSMEVLLSNLLENAFDASFEGAEVRIEVRKGEGVVSFDIHNRGAIPEEIRDTFFDRYVTHGKNHGTGIGTYSAYLIVRTHGGTIRFTSSEEEGTHLLVEIPSP